MEKRNQIQLDFAKSNYNLNGNLTGWSSHSLLKQPQIPDLNFIQLKFVDKSTPILNCESETQPIKYMIESSLPELTAYADPQNSFEKFNTRVNRSVDAIPVIATQTEY